MRPFRVVFRGLHIPHTCSRKGTTTQCSIYSSSIFDRLAAQPFSTGTCSHEELEVKRKRGRPRKTSPTTLLQSGPVLVASDETATAAERYPPSPSFLETPSRIQPSSSSPPSSVPTNNSLSHRLQDLPSPPLSATISSAKLHALHARLALPARLPVETLARTLVDATADPDARFNNSSLAAIGNDLLGYYMAEHLLCHYPRLPLAVLLAAQAAYVGPKALGSVTRDWGVDVAAEPGGEVDPGLLQFRRTPPGTIPVAFETTRPDKSADWRRGMSSRVVYDDQFGDVQPSRLTALSATADAPLPTTTLGVASTTFMRALFAAIYLHAGAAAAHTFFSAHILSRHLDLSSLFAFAQPTRDLSRLCAREGFEAPVARVLAETGRLSRHPVFVVGVFSGGDKLGEGAGASLDEARFRAAVAALKGWYLYSPAGEIMVPSDVEGERGSGKTFRPAIIDDGEIVA